MRDPASQARGPGIPPQPRCSPPTGPRSLDDLRDGLRPGEPRRFRSKQGLVDLATAAQRQLVLAAEPKMARDFVACELGAAVLEQRGGLDGSRRNDECGHVLAS